MKRMLLVLLILVALAVIASLLHFDGDVHAVDAQMVASIHDSATWFGRPQLVSNASDSNAIYLIAPEVPRDNKFAAVRIDTASGAQTDTQLVLGPESPFRPFVPAHVKADVRGVRFERPALHLMTFPDGKGPGVHGVDSATGRLAIVVDKGSAHRPLLTRTVFNSSSAAEMLSLVSADPGGRWIAALSRSSGGWKLYLFSA